VVLAAGAGYLFGGPGRRAAQLNQPAAAPLPIAGLDSTARPEPEPPRPSPSSAAAPRVRVADPLEVAAADERRDARPEREANRRLAAGRLEDAVSALAKAADAATPRAAAEADSIGRGARAEDVKDAKDAAAIEVSALEAIDALGGALRLIDGLRPERFELAGRVVRVHYATEVGGVVLEEWREGEAIRTRIRPGPGVPADSVDAWSRRVR
jgi:hypothetical protein